MSAAANMKRSGMLCGLVVVIMVGLVEATPPGIANNPSNATCTIKKYKHCYNLVHVCPKFCPDSCSVHCASCKPICGAPPPEESDDSPPTPSTPISPAVPPTPSTPTVSPPTPSTPSSVSAPPTDPSSSTPPTPSPIPVPPTDFPYPSPAPAPWYYNYRPSIARCGNTNYPYCYNVWHNCPAGCPDECMVDCVTCKAVCSCDFPGAVCHDPRFIGGDGITFYFHGKKERDFCLVSDSELHINGHFIGVRNAKTGREFTWVQSIAIFVGRHQVLIGALKTSTWDNSVDRLTVAVDDQPISLPESDGAGWTTSGLSVVRLGQTNGVMVEMEGSFKITAKVTPITAEDSRIHNYGMTADDCLAHLELAFKFYALSDQVDGVLGQTYRPGYVSRAKIGAKMPVLGGDRDFKTSGLFKADCAVARFQAGGSTGSDMFSGGMELRGLNCASGIDGQGRGVVCKR